MGSCCGRREGEAFLEVGLEAWFDLVEVVGVGDVLCWCEGVGAKVGVVDFEDMSVGV